MMTWLRWPAFRAALASPRVGEARRPDAMDSPSGRVSPVADRLPEPLVQPHSLLARESRAVCLAHTCSSVHVCGVMNLTDSMNACIRRVETVFDCYKSKNDFQN